MKNRNIIFGAILSALVSFALCQQVQAQDTPDPGSVGPFNTADGDHALSSNTSGFANSAFGWYALGFGNTDGSYNTAVGAGALDLNNGLENTAVGVAALLLNTTGSFNNAVGSTALESNTTGTFNNAHGRAALFSNVDGGQNNAMGDLALTSNTSGNTNTGIGDDALFSVTTGNSNTALGDEAGSNLIDGEGNIYIGAAVQAGATGEFEFIRIGDDTAFTFPYDTFIAGIFNRAVDAGTAQAVFVDATGKLGTLAVNGIGNKGAPRAVPQRLQPHAIGQDPKQAMLNRKVEKQQATIAELKSTIAQQQKQLEKQQKQMEIVTAQLKAQAAQIQKVSAQIQLSRPAPRTVANGD